MKINSRLPAPALERPAPRPRPDRHGRQRDQREVLHELVAEPDVAEPPDHVRGREGGRRAKRRRNMKVLYDAMTKAGFANYPLEWWHYSYGDRMWAAYSGKEECFYGPVVHI